MTYIPILDDELLPDAPITSPIGFRLRDNLIAIAEGTPGAPYESSMWRPYNSNAWGDGGDGVLYNGTADDVVRQLETPTFQAGWQYAFSFENIAANGLSTAHYISIALFTSSYTSDEQVASSSSQNLPLSGTMIIGSPMVPKRCHEVKSVIYNSATSAVWVSPQTYNKAFYYSSNQQVVRIRFTFSSSIISGINRGVVRMYKRRANPGYGIY